MKAFRLLAAPSMATLLAVSTTTAGAAAEASARASEADRAVSRTSIANIVDDEQAAARYARQLELADPSHLLSLGQEALWLTIGTMWYWLDRERNLADWDFPSWEQRFSLEAWRLDNNEFPINFIAHPLNGAAFYACPRANDIDPYVATLYAFGTSFIWEFLIEFREKVSINDMLITPVAGLPIGEFAAKLWRYVNGVPPAASTGQQVAAAAIGSPVWLHRRIDGAPPALDEGYDELGLSAAMKHRFTAGYQLRLHDFGELASTHGFHVGGRLSTIPYEGRPGKFGLFFHDADIASVQLNVGLGREAREVELFAEAQVLGYYRQHIDRSGDGHSLVIGMPVAYRYRFQDFEGWNDRLGLLHLPGLGADFTVHSGTISFASRARLHADFAGLHSAAYSAWEADSVGPGDRPKTILRKHNYYYAWGVSSQLGAKLSIGPLELAAELRMGAYDSQDDLDRAQEEITLDPDGSDRLLELEASIGLTIPDTPVRIAVGSTSTDRISRVERHTVERDKQTWTLSGSFVF